MMPGIANLTILEFQTRINRFSERYIEDWNSWLNTQPNRRSQQLGIVLRRWQACRPNSMRRTLAENQHDSPYLEDLINEANTYIEVLKKFDIRNEASFSNNSRQAITELWRIFERLSYRGRARNGLAGNVGISKAVLLLTDGRVGPAFDREVKRHLGTGVIENADQWINALRVSSRDIQEFEYKNQTTIQLAAPFQHIDLNSGRIYDMALGPRALIT